MKSPVYINEIHRLHVEICFFRLVRFLRKALTTQGERFSVAAAITFKYF
jgi:hypothetical protein